MPVHHGVISAAKEGRKEELLRLIKNGADVHEKDSEGGTALLWASENGHLDCVTALIQSGADVNEKDSYGVTALMRASFNGHVECVNVLIDNGADVNEKRSNGWTVLMQASFYGHVECVNVLIDNGADVNEKDSIGITALMRASFNRQVECVNALIDNGAVVNEKASNGNTALMLASSKGHLECCKTLIAHGADGNERNAEGKSALDRADRHIRKELQLLLEEAARKSSQHNVCTACQCNDCVALRQRDTKNANDFNSLTNKVSNLEDQIARLELSRMRPSGTNMVHKDYLPDYKRKLLDRIEANAHTIVTTMDPGPVIDKLLDNDVITATQYEEVNSGAYPTDSAKAAYVLRLVQRGPRFLVGIKRALQETDQTEVDRLFT